MKSRKKNTTATKQKGDTSWHNTMEILPMRTFNMRMTVKKKNTIIIMWNAKLLPEKPFLTGS